MERKAQAQWRGGIRNGEGTLTTDSGTLSGTPYSFTSRFENGAGTNPEELIAAAHAGCFSMALSLILGESGVEPEEIDTTAAVTIEREGEGFAIPRIELTVEVRAPGLDDDAFQRAAEQAKSGCPVSKLLNASISMHARLVG